MNNTAVIVVVGLGVCLLSFCGGVIANSGSDDDLRTDYTTLAMLTATGVLIFLGGFLAAIFMQ